MTPNDSERTNARTQPVVKTPPARPTPNKKEKEKERGSRVSDLRSSRLWPLAVFHQSCLFAVDIQMHHTWKDQWTKKKKQILSVKFMKTTNLFTEVVCGGLSVYFRKTEAQRTDVGEKMQLNKGLSFLSGIMQLDKAS